MLKNLGKILRRFIIVLNKLLNQQVIFYLMFGFGKKQIEIILEKLNFSHGDAIRGKVILTLKNPTHAKALKVGIVGERTTTTTSTINGRLTTNTKNMTVFKFDMPLDGEKDYFQGEYRFELKVPGNISQPSTPQGVAGDVIKAIQILSARESDVRWYVTAKLDIPMRFDIDTKMQINIG